MLNVRDRETEYLLSLIRCAIEGESAPSADGVDMDKLFVLAKDQQVYCLVLPLLEEADLLNSKQLSVWKNYKLSELKKTILVNTEREKLFEELEKQGIDYMPIKGLVIREYYPKTSMRQMSDNDILYNVEKRNELMKIMKRNNYYLSVESGPSDDFIKPPCTFEFHRKLFNDNDNFGFNLNLWERAEKIENTHNWIINKEDNYLYSIMHMYKHFVFGGFGIRFICDQYVLRKGKDYDFDYINQKLEEFNLTDFHKIIVDLCNAVFCDGVLTERENDIFDAMISGTVYGKPFDLEKAIERSGGKLGYFLYRVFPPKEVMRDSYQKLEKAPYLLPYYYLRRIAERFHYNGDAAIKEVKNIFGYKKD